MEKQNKPKQKCQRGREEGLDYIVEIVNPCSENT